MPNIPVKGCCGCTACASICPVSAISMKPNTEGFLYPHINHERCVSCGRCELVCPILQPPVMAKQYMAAAVAQSTDDQVLQECTSGGFIDAVNQHITEERNGYAVGVAFDERFLPVHKITHSYEEAKAFRNSKYAQSSLDGVFPQVKDLLDQGADVVFTGTPCQVAGLKAFLDREYGNLITIDLVCRSVPSPTLWRSYLDWQEEKHGHKIEKAACRRKTFGYHSGALEIVFENGKRYTGSNRVDYYMKCFHKDVCSRWSCYECAFKTEHRCSDFTVFDCWRPEAVSCENMVDNDRGYSNVIVHTTKGLDVLHVLKNIRIVQAVPEKMFQFTGGMESRSIDKTPVRECFYTSLAEHGFIETAKKYVRVSWKDHLIEFLKPMRFYVKKWIKTVKWK